MLAPGTRIGSCEIVALLGRGGMGEVYRARDTTLGRDVALKVIADPETANVERFARLVREATTLATLNHPHIAQVYGRVDDGATQAIVMELVEGQDLSERLSRGRLPVPEALAIARQVALAIEAAHAVGIVHRDLKPANIKVRRDGTTKVLDFGLAKDVGQPAAFASAASANGLTIQGDVALTSAGTVLGTAAYMAPEQAKGQIVDRRADIWAFGAVVYEMLTGRAAFQGKTATEIVAAVIEREPNWEALPASTPARVKLLLKRCLAKDPSRRLRDIGDAQFELDEPDLASPAPRRLPVTAVALSVAVAAVLGGLAASTLRSSPPQQDAWPIRRTELRVEGLEATVGSEPAISPDGGRIAYRAAGRLWVRDLTEFQAREVPGSSDVMAAFWSPDGSRLAFGANRKMWLAPARLDSLPTPICDVPESGRVLAGAWHPDGTLMFSVWRGSLYAVNERGGQPELRFATDPQKEIDFHSVSFLPDSHDLLAARHDTDGGFSVQVLAKNGQRTTLVKSGRSPALATPTMLLYVDDAQEALVAADVSLKDGTVSSGTTLILREVYGAGVSTTGTLLAASSPHSTNQLVWVDRSGRVTAAIGEPQVNLSSPALSPNGRLVAVAAELDHNSDVWVHDIDRGTRVRLTASEDMELEPSWSPDGRRIAFTSGNTASLTKIMVVGADASSAPMAFGFGLFPRFSHDASRLIFASDRTGDNDIQFISIAEGGSPVRFQATPARETRPVQSPDGRWLAFVSNETGRDEVYVRRFPEAADLLPVSQSGGNHPRWRKDGKELYFSNGQTMMAVSITTSGDQLVAGAPQRLFVAGSDIPPEYMYDVAADGQRFVMVRTLETASARPRLLLTENWLSNFERSGR